MEVKEIKYPEQVKANDNTPEARAERKAVRRAMRANFRANGGPSGK